MAIALEEKPTCLEPLRATFVSASEPEEQPQRIIFAIACRTCGATRFRLREIRHGDNPTGIAVHCIQCGTEDEVFDGLVHGYDGKLGHTAQLKGTKAISELKWADGTSPTVENLFAIFTYNAEMSELPDICDEEGIPVIELFDWFELATAKEGTQPPDYDIVWDYECA